VIWRESVGAEQVFAGHPQPSAVAPSGIAAIVD